MTLPFLGLIVSIMRHERVQFAHDLPGMKRKDQIFAQTVTRSKARFPVPGEEEERAKGKDTASEGGNTDEDIDNFTLDLEDMEATPTQLQQQPQAQPCAPSHAPNHINLLLDRFDYFQQSQEAMQRSLDKHRAYTTTQMMYL